MHLSDKLLLPPVNEVWGKVMFLLTSVILSKGGGVSVQGVSGGLCPGVLSSGVSVERALSSGMSVHWGICPVGVSVWVVSV